ncbi:hypothetical protein GCM10010182_00380 [Actinomadura cremea]|nr:hypothetical protein GCM10010182_00380 [Actinomadura cremea]
MNTPYSPGVEMYPRQYASVAVLAERLSKRGLIVKRIGDSQYNQISVGVPGVEEVAVVEWKPRPDDPGAHDQLWWWVNDEPVEPVDSPDATNRVVEAVRLAEGEAGCDG